MAIDDGAEGKQGEMFAQRESDGESPRINPVSTSCLLVREPEEGAVCDVNAEPDEPPAAPPGHELAEDGDVRVVVTDDPHVERLLDRPHGGRNGPGDG